MALNLITASLSKRFPYLHREIRILSDSDMEFVQLAEDYESLVQLLSDRQAETDRDREELINLKKALELEALEKLSLIQAKL